MTLVATADCDGIATVTLDDPARYNALSGAMVTELKGAFAAIREARQVRAVILTGAGRGFCAGANLAGNDELPERARDRGPVGLVQMMQEHLAELVLAIHELPQPLPAPKAPASVVQPGGSWPLLSWYMCRAMPIWCRLLEQLERLAASRTFWTAGRSRPIRMAMMAITTSNSISVNAGRPRERKWIGSMG